MSASSSMNGLPPNLPGASTMESTTIKTTSSHADVTNEQDLRTAQLRGEEISISEEQLIRAIDRAIKSIQGPETRLDFSVHEQTKRIMVKVINSQSGEIIREIPQEKHLDLLAKLWQMAGILVDERR